MRVVANRRCASFQQKLLPRHPRYIRRRAVQRPERHAPAHRQIAVNVGDVRRHVRPCQPLNHRFRPQIVPHIERRAFARKHRQQIRLRILFVLLIFFRVIPLFAEDAHEVPLRSRIHPLIHRQFRRQHRLRPLRRNGMQKRQQRIRRVGGHVDEQRQGKQVNCFGKLQGQRRLPRNAHIARLHRQAQHFIQPIERRLDEIPIPRQKIHPRIAVLLHLPRQPHRLTKQVRSQHGIPRRRVPQLHRLNRA